LNFTSPNSYLPERWLHPTPSRFIDDNRAVLQPFSVGPRNCIGRNLAYNEMRLILARVLWNFDLELCPESENWTEQKIFFLWEKLPLFLKLKKKRGGEG
jgi:cytochrome P450